jgi:hypothetical protein
VRVKDVDSVRAKNRGESPPAPKRCAMRAIDGDERHSCRVEDLTQGRPRVSARDADHGVEALTVQVGDDRDREPLGTSGLERVEQRENTKTPRPADSAHSTEIVPTIAGGPLSEVGGV